MKPVEQLVVGCGSVGLPLLVSLARSPEHRDKLLALEASARVGGSTFFVSRLYRPGDYSPEVYEEVRTLPELKIWWERAWLKVDEVDWSHKDWAFALPQWKFYFGKLVELKLKAEVATESKDLVVLEKPVSELIRADGRWTLRSGEKLFNSNHVHWTLGLKAFQSAYGKKEAEEFMVKNPTFDEASREAEGVFVAEYKSIPSPASAPPSETDPQFVGIPVRHEGKFFLSFVSVNGPKVETFTYLHPDALKQPKEISFFEKSLKRSIKHVLATGVAELSEPNLGIINEARGFETASPWMLASDPQQGIEFSARGP